MKMKAKYEFLKTTVKDLQRVVVAFSGGVDSTFLLKVSVDTLGKDNVLAFIGKSPTCPAREMDQAQRLALQIDAQYIVAETSEMDDPRFIENHRSRCYFCKTHLFTKAREIAASRGFLHVLEGSNADDVNDFRPGRKACAEQGVKSPLLDAGLTKLEIRRLSKRLLLPTYDKPSFACLSSRVPYGTAIDEILLKNIERAEDYLQSLGVRQVRVRHHGDTARIEVLRKDFRVILAHGEAISDTFRQCGFAHVALDLRGYQTGSMNISLAQQNR
ncbi:MAG TPA: ATP-dependent sacrificial sulfur transferase LarE [Syntrophorhabdaceae bacterium]|nr:ATP-dependent sacrificial sulfur transferase LarE [Syntrophorhabdaceae bacterium]